MKRCMLVCVAALSLLVVRDAAAASILFAQAFDFGGGSSALNTTDSVLTATTGSEGHVAVSRFNSALGTLQSVDISFTSFWRSAVEGSAVDSVSEFDPEEFLCFIVPLDPCSYVNDANMSGVVDTSLQIELTGLGAASSLFALPSVSVSCSESVTTDSAVECYDAFSEIGFYNGSLDVSATPLAAFIGSSPLDFKFVERMLLLVMCDNDDRADTCRVEERAFWVGTLFVTYGYDAAVLDPTDPTDPTDPAAPVPEPTSLLLVASGMIGAGVRRWRRLRLP